MKRFLTLGSFIFSLSLMDCSTLLTSGEDDKSQEQGALMLALLANQCSIGGQSFTPSSGVTCRLNFAQGTGSLSATSTSRDDLSFQITFTLGTGGSLDSLGGAAQSNITGAHGMKFTTGTAVGHGKNGTPTETMNAAIIPVVNVPKTVCLEHHTKEADVHMVADNAACTPKSAATATFSSTTAWGARSGTYWGFALENATIHSISLNANVPVFTE